MWEWLTKQTQRVLNTLGLNAHYIDVNAEDIVQNVLINLLADENLARDIYENKKYRLLYTIVKREVYASEASGFSNKMELSRFQRIMSVCSKYNIDPIPENAYKISAILDNADDNNYEFSIASVASKLSFFRPDVGR